MADDEVKCEKCRRPVALIISGHQLGYSPANRRAWVQCAPCAGVPVPAVLIPSIREQWWNAALAPTIHGYAPLLTVAPTPLEAWAKLGKMVGAELRAANENTVNVLRDGARAWRDA